MLNARWIVGWIAVVLLGSAALGAEPNETFATRTLLPSGVFLVADQLTADHPYPDTYLGILSLAGEFGLVDDDSSLYGDGFASGLQSVEVESDSIRFAVTGFGDSSFTGAHAETGQFEVFVHVQNAGGELIDVLSELRTLAPGTVHEFLFSDSAWTDGQYNVNIENRRPPNDIDFFTFSGLIPGASFAARTLNPSIPLLDTYLGWYDDAGSLMSVNDDYGQAALSRIVGAVPASGTLTFAVTGFGDFGFEGLHSQAGGYELQVVQTVEAVPGDYNGDLYVNAADYTVWRNRLGQEYSLNGENPDAMTLGVVDQEDYAFWKLHFGEGLGGTGAVAHPIAAPEPSSVVLVVLGAAFLLLSRRGCTGC